MKKRMKKRMRRVKMTETQLAVGMWVYIYPYVSTYTKAKEIGNSDYYNSISDLKERYLRTHGYGHIWKNSCLLCNRYFYYSNCTSCPLSEGGKDCDTGSSWQKATLYRRYGYRRKALYAIKKIMNVMLREKD